MNNIKLFIVAGLLVLAANIAYSKSGNAQNAFDNLDKEEASYNTPPKNQPKPEDRRNAKAEVKTSSAAVFNPSENYTATVIVSAKQGSGAGEFGYLKTSSGEVIPSGLAADKEGNIYVLDGIHKRVEKFDAKGKFADIFGVEGGADNEFYGTSGQNINFVSDAAGNLYIKSGSGIFEKGEKENTFKIAVSSKDLSGKGFDEHNLVLLTPDEKGSLYIYSLKEDKTYKVSNLKTFDLASYGKGRKGRGEFTFDDRKPSAPAEKNDKVLIYDKDGKEVSKIALDSLFVAVGSKETEVSCNAVDMDHARNVYIEAALRNNSSGKTSYYTYIINSDGKLISQIPYSLTLGNDGSLYSLSRSDKKGFEILRIEIKKEANQNRR